MPHPTKRVAVIGECLVELNGQPFGPIDQTFGGDSLNTALYLSRIAHPKIHVQYISAVGNDPLSADMIRRWQTDGIDTRLVLRDATHRPGLYWIQLDAGGERTFLYWRSESAARFLLQHPGFDAVAQELPQNDLIYLSAISLAILPPEDRTRLLALLLRLAANGATLAFDSNYRPELWPSPESARAATETILPATRLMFVTFDDERQLWGDATPDATVARLADKSRLLVVKLGAAGCLYSDGLTTTRVPAHPVPRVIDTTAAGDAFSAGFLAGWLVGRHPRECCVAGNTLAGIVIQHRGAIIPSDATPMLSHLFK